MRHEARHLDIGTLEYSVGPVGASDAVTLSEGLSIVITVVVILANDLLKKPV
jgi:hypothetical protein